MDARRIKPLSKIRDGELDVPDWTDEFKQPWLPGQTEDWEKSPSMQHWKDLAWRIQDDTEKVLLDRAIWLRQATGAKNLCIAGGVALNCVANGRSCGRRDSRMSGFSRRPATMELPSAVRTMAMWRFRRSRARS